MQNEATYSIETVRFSLEEKINNCKRVLKHIYSKNLEVENTIENGTDDFLQSLNILKKEQQLVVDKLFNELDKKHYKDVNCDSIITFGKLEKSFIAVNTNGKRLRNNIKEKSKSTLSALIMISNDFIKLHKIISNNKYDDKIDLFKNKINSLDQRFIAIVQEWKEYHTVVSGQASKINNFIKVLRVEEKKIREKISIDMVNIDSLQASLPPLQETSTDQNERSVKEKSTKRARLREKSTDERQKDRILDPPAQDKAQNLFSFFELLIKNIQSMLPNVFAKSGSIFEFFQKKIQKFLDYIQAKLGSASNDTEEEHINESWRGIISFAFCAVVFLPSSIITYIILGKFFEIGFFTQCFIAMITSSVAAHQLAQRIKSLFKLLKFIIGTIATLPVSIIIYTIYGIFFDFAFFSQIYAAFFTAIIVITIIFRKIKSIGKLVGFVIVTGVVSFLAFMLYRFLKPLLRVLNIIGLVQALFSAMP